MNQAISKCQREIVFLLKYIGFYVVLLCLYVYFYNLLIKIQHLINNLALQCETGGDTECK